MTKDVIYLPVAMDTRAGRVVLWEPSSRSTWTFDVCTDQWRPMRTRSGPPADVRAMIYDAADDVTVAFAVTTDGTAQLSMSTYSSATNRWTLQPLPVAGPRWVVMPDVTYDSRTGVIYVRDAGSGALWYYTARTNRWTSVNQYGELPPSGATRSSAGVFTWLVYDARADRLVLVLGVDDPASRTFTFDPGTRLWTRQPVEAPDLDGGYLESNGEAVYDVAHARIVVYSFARAAAYDSAAGSWSIVPATAASPDPLGRHYPTLVYDPVNERILMVGGTPDGMTAFNDVWALDLAAARWVRLVPSS